MTTPITKTIPTRDRWIDKTTQYPEALAKNTKRTAIITTAIFAISMLSAYLFIPAMLIAVFLVARLIRSYRHFKQSKNDIKSMRPIKRLIPIYGIGLISLSSLGTIFSSAAIIWAPMISGTVTCLLLAAAWVYLGRVAGYFLYPDLFKPPVNQGSIWDQSMLDPSNLNGFTNPSSPNYNN